MMNFVHVDIKVPQSWAIRPLRRGKSRKPFTNSASKWGTEWRTTWSFSSGCIPFKKRMNKYESVNNMSVKFFKLLKNSHYVIINDFYELVWCSYVPSMRRIFSSSTHVVIIMNLVITLWMTIDILLN
jgi:hypothetical protein